MFCTLSFPAKLIEAYDAIIDPFEGVVEKENNSLHFT